MLLSAAVCCAGSSQLYYWKTEPAGNSAQLVTLFCNNCTPSNGRQDVPVIAVLRDTLGDTEQENDRLVYLWLLGYSSQSVSQRMLAAVPFFFWRVGAGSGKVGKNDPKPLIDLIEPAHPVMSGLNRSLLQWAVLDPMTMPVRASSRAYQGNETDDERLHLEEAIGFLRQAPADDAASGLSQTEIDTLTARLSLRKQLLGGLVGERDVEKIGENERFSNERIRSRNWELLRQCAEKTGLLFEPLRLAGGSEDYAILWFAVERGPSGQAAGVETGSIWKLLNIKDPWKDDRLKNWQGPTRSRSLGDDGSLMPEGANGSPVHLVPLAAYSLDYPRMPLLLIDFRNRRHVRRNEMAQRSINQLTGGVIGVSHFANWYYFAGADIYRFIAGRHGGALNQSQRLDCYSQFRAALALDNSLDASLRDDMRKRLDSVSVNPLEVSPVRDLQLAEARYNNLLRAASDGTLSRKLELERRAELADFGRTPQRETFDATLHGVTLGVYSRRAAERPENLRTLDRDRRVQRNLDFLDTIVRAQTKPEVAYRTERIAASVNELSALLPDVLEKRVREHAAVTLTKLRDLTGDESLRADCSFAVRAATGSRQTGVLTNIRSLHPPQLPPLEPVQ